MQRQTQFYRETESSDQQMLDKHGHVVISVLVILHLCKNTCFLSQMMSITTDYSVTKQGNNFSLVQHSRQEKKLIATESRCPRIEWCC